MLWLKQRIRQLDKSGAQLARALGLPKERVYEMYVGKRRLQAEEIGPTARFLEWTEADIIARLEGRILNETNNRVVQSSPQVNENESQPLGDITGTPLVIYRTVTITDRGRGSFMLFQEPIDEVPRPFFLKFSTKAFGVKILDDSNSPVYKRWDTVLVDPAGSMAEGEDHIFTENLGTAGGQSVIGCLKSSTATHWTVHHYNSKRDQDLPRSQYPNAWPIVGRYNRR